MGHVATDTERKARKAHVCEECLTEIAPGTVYRYQTGVYDGRWYAYRAHAECADWCATLTERGDMDEWDCGLQSDPAGYAEDAPEIVRERLLRGMS